MINEVKEFLKKRKKADLMTISCSLKLDRIMTQHALQLLIHKGIVKEEKIKIPCKSCNCGGKCIDEKVYIYN